ncbi:MAG: serine O-acetyltransferase [Chloroflexi bacterium RBG_16_60_22]|nr:MAG: serine O-acetyltransferase [Chloroflexi bacterium RBG_16_60_22]
MREDIRTVFDKDPAARSVLEVLTCYPGLHALWSHRLANYLWRHKLRLIARLCSHFTRAFTGIEIHPGATIGRRFFIDHGSGVVIGETAEIGSDVLLYQGVVLGGTTLEKKKRHPTLGNGVEMGTGAIALGPINIGEGARIGAGSVVIKSVPAGVTVVGIPGRIVTKTEKPTMDLEHGRLPDPVAEAIRLVLKEQQNLEERLERLEEASGVAVPQDELKEQRREIEREFAEGAGI